jgi:hypothetical protein
MDSIFSMGMDHTYQLLLYETLFTTVIIIKEKMQNFEVVSDTFKVVRICTSKDYAKKGITK